MLHIIHVEFNVNWMKKGNGFYLIYLLKKNAKILPRQLSDNPDKSVSFIIVLYKDLHK